MLPMLEINRLKPMVDNYDPIKFKRLYAITENLRRKLASGIDHRRFGVTQEDIISWFSDKFIYAYNKYCNEIRDEEILKGHLIKAMQFIKCRILRAAYQPKFSHPSIEFTPDLIDGNFHPYDDETKDHYYNALCKFLQERISDNAYMLFQLQLNPPMYVLHEMKMKGHDNIHKIPEEVICNYFNLGFDVDNIKLLKSLRKEINTNLDLAKEHFANN